MEKVRVKESRYPVVGVAVSLIRVADGRTEASGFKSRKEAEEWAQQMGHEVVR